MVALALYISLLLSGVAGLGYELAWTRMLTVGLGHELPSVLAVVTAFFLGIALGAWALDGVVSRSPTPGRWYAGAEALIGLWSLATIKLVPWVNGLLPRWIGPTPLATYQWLVGLSVPLVILLPATTAMGCTLPAIDRLCCRLRRDGRAVAGLYAVNTLGAVLGVLLTAHVIIPSLGYRRGLALLAMLSLASAGIVLLGPARRARSAVDAQALMPGRPAAWRLHLTLAMTGLLGVGYEVLCVRVMSQVLENTIFSFASALAVFLLGTAAGAAVYQVLLRRPSYDRPLAVLLSLLAASTALGVVILGRSFEIYESARTMLGGGFTGSVLAEMILAGLVFGAPTLLMGATFGHLAQAARTATGGVGAAVGVNTLGSALAPVVFGVLLLPAVGSKLAVVLVATGYLALLPRFWPLAHGVVTAVVVGVAVAAPDLMLVRPAAHEQVLVAHEGIRATVAVIGAPGMSTDAPRTRQLTVNNRLRMGGTGPGVFLQQRMAHLPLLMHADPRRVLFLGLGTGITFATVGFHAGVEGDGVELLPEVVALLPEFGEDNAALHNGQRLRVYAADARRFVRCSTTPYDVIVADLFHPASDGAGALYTVEHFMAVRERLADQGLFCQWLPLYQLDDEVLRIIIRSFLEVFPDARAWWAYFNVQTPVLGLVGEVQPRRYPDDWYLRRVREPSLAEALLRAGLRSDVQFLGCLAAAAEDLQAFAGPGPQNTDDHPLVAMRAPYMAYCKDRPAHANLIDLLCRVMPKPQVLLDAQGGAMAERLEHYLRARDVFFRAHIASAEGSAAEYQRLLVESVAQSSDFHPAYDTALVLARQYAATDAARAGQLLRDLQNANPQRPEAGALLHSLNLRAHP